MKNILRLITVLFLFSVQLIAAEKVNQSKQVKKTIIVYLENHSFFNLFANFPGADNEVSKDYLGQVDSANKPYTKLPPVTERHATLADSRFPKELPNKPFLIDSYVKQEELTPDPSHEFYTHQVQINNGANDKFVLYSGVGALVMGYYDIKETYFWSLAKEYVLADQFYQSAFGGSFLNHMWLISAQTPLYKNALDKIKIELDQDGIAKKSKPLTPDGYVVNLIQPFHPPFDKKETDVNNRLPPLDYPTIGERLSEKKIKWAWYAGGWNAILKDENPDNFQFHHQPFIYFKNFAPDTKGRKEHLKDEEDLFAAIKSENLPEVSFYKPVGIENMHPGYANVTSGFTKVQKLIELLKKSKQWKQSLVIITFDEHGGFWDPKSPRKIDRWGLGTRIPAIFVSPYVKKGVVDHTPYETVSILSYLEKKYALKPLSDRDKNADPLSGIWLDR